MPAIRGVPLKFAVALLAASVLWCAAGLNAAAATDCAADAQSCMRTCKQLYAKLNPKFFRYCVKQCKRDRAACQRGQADPARAPATSPKAERAECEREFRVCMRSCKTAACEKACRRGRAMCLRDNYSRPLNPDVIAPVIPRTTIERGPRVGPRPAAPLVPPGLLEGDAGGFPRQAPAPTGTPVVAPPPPRTR